MSKAKTTPIDVLPDLPGAIRFTDREAIRLVNEEAKKTGEPLGKVAARCIIRIFASNQQPAQPATA